MSVKLFHRSKIIDKNTLPRYEKSNLQVQIWYPDLCEGGQLTQQRHSRLQVHTRTLGVEVDE